MFAKNIWISKLFFVQMRFTIISSNKLLVQIVENNNQLASHDIFTSQILTPLQKYNNRNAYDQINKYALRR